MKAFIFFCLALMGGLGLANAQNATVNTVFTVGGQQGNCLSVVAQDGVIAPPRIYCASGPYLFLQNTQYSQWLTGPPVIGIYVSLLSDPLNAGHRLNTACVPTLVSDSTVTQPTTAGLTASTVYSLDCPTSYSYFSTDWQGQLMLTYTSVYTHRCSSGRGAHCVYFYAWTNTGGTGQLSSPIAPPPPPPPPAPVEIPLVNSTCDVNLVCQIVPADNTVILGGQVDPNYYILTVNNADGTTDVLGLGYVAYAASGDDGGSYTEQATGSLYDANGVDIKDYNLSLNLVVDQSSGLYYVTGGNLEEVTP
jgi:hypothetical protein